MIHTLEFYTNISQIEREIIESNHKRSIKQIIIDLNNVFKRLNLRIGRKMWNGSYNVYLQFDAVELLEREDDGYIDEQDYETIQSNIEVLENRLFGGLEKTFILNRIDYRIDVKVHLQEHRKCLFKLWRKMAYQVGHLKKRNKSSVKMIESEKGTTFVSEKAFKTTLYFASKSLAICVYDKEEERQAKGIEAKPYEQDVIRFEVRLMSKHLAYKAREGKRERSLKAYMTTQCFNEYTCKYVFELFGTQDFYKISEVRKRLENTLISDNQQYKIIAFLKLISRSGVEAAVGYRKGKKKGYSRYLFNKYKKMLQCMEIHIILLPLKSPIKESILPNPLGNVFNNNIKLGENIKDECRTNNHSI